MRPDSISHWQILRIMNNRSGGGWTVCELASKAFGVPYPVVVERDHSMLIDEDRHCMEVASVVDWLNHLATGTGPLVMVTVSDVSKPSGVHWTLTAAGSDAVQHHNRSDNTYPELDPVDHEPDTPTLVVFQPRKDRTS